MNEIKLPIDRVGNTHEFKYSKNNFCWYCKKCSVVVSYSTNPTFIMWGYSGEKYFDYYLDDDEIPTCEAVIMMEALK